jgi:hypothetical protein
MGASAFLSDRSERQWRGSGKKYFAVTVGAALSNLRWFCAFSGQGCAAVAFKNGFPREASESSCLV